MGSTELVWSCTADASGNVNAPTLTGTPNYPIAGAAARVEIIPGTAGAQPTTGFAVTLNPVRTGTTPDTTSDFLQGLAASCSNSASTIFDTDSGYVAPIPNRLLIPGASGVGSAKTFTIKVWVTPGTASSPMQKVLSTLSAFMKTFLGQSTASSALSVLGGAPSVSPQITGAAAITSFAGTMSTSGTALAFTSSADAVAAGYPGSRGFTVTHSGTSTHILSWTNSTTAVIDSSPSWGAGTAISSAQAPISAETDSTGVLQNAVFASGKAYFAGSVGIGTTTPDNTIQVANLINFDNTLLNTWLGYQAGYSNTTGSYNNANGYQSLYFNTTGSYNTANGFQSLYYNTTGNFSTANGFESLYSNTTGVNNTANGYESLYSNTTGSYNNANGYQSLYSNTTGSYNTANGYESLCFNTTGVNNNANGYASLYSNTTGSYNNANGYQSLYFNTTGVNNNANGYASLYSNTTGSYNNANGYQSLYSNTTGSYTNANGYRSLYYNTTNVATLGTITGGSLYTPGTYTGIAMTLSSGSTATTYPTATIVVSAGGAVSSVTITSPGARFKDTTTVLTAPAASIGGTGSGFSVPVASLNAGSGNTALGYQAGTYISGGSVTNAIATNSLYLGNSAYPLTDGDTNETVIGYSAVGNGSNSTTIGNSSVTKTIISAGNVGIGDTTPPTKVSIQDSTVLGTESCSNPADFSQSTWTLAGDFAINGTAATFTKSSGSGTITQTAANQAQASAGLRKYQIQYIVSAAPTEVGGTMLLTTGFAGASATLPIAAGTNTVLFYSTASPASIVLSVSGVTSGAFTITSVSVQEIQGGFITVGGGINFGPTLITAGATGNKTINKSAGQVRIAAAGTTVTVTNNLVTARSIVIAVPASNDTTAQVKNVVAAAGSFTINMVAGVTAETPVSFVVFN
jgi:hypothetical protein